MLEFKTLLHTVHIYWYNKWVHCPIPEVYRWEKSTESSALIRTRVMKTLYNTSQGKSKISKENRVYKDKKREIYSEKDTNKCSLPSAQVHDKCRWNKPLFCLYHIISMFIVNARS